MLQGHSGAGTKGAELLVRQNI